MSGSIAVGAGLGSLVPAKNTKVNAAPGTVKSDSGLREPKDDISIAQWALVREI